MDECLPANLDFFEEVTRQTNSPKALNRLEKKTKKEAKQRGRHPLPLKPKTEKQADYLDAMRTKDQVFGIGGAGTGKTYVAARFAVQELAAGNFEKIVITRPTVSRPEHRMGFLPGSAKQKMEPWLIPIIAAMKDQEKPAEIEAKLKSEIIEFVPFEHMRGRTFNNAFILLDEAQNCTISDLRLFLTRIGEESTVVVSGDVDQVDIPNSGLAEVLSMIKRYRMNADVVEFGPEDVVRSKIAKEWVNAFARQSTYN